MLRLPPALTLVERLRARYEETEQPVSRKINIMIRERKEAADRIEELEALLNTPQLHDFASAVALEAAHQRARWGSEHDAGKEPQDWFWLLGYLGGKALKAHQTADVEKALHHTISTAAALANWHAAISGDSTSMRPGIMPPTLSDGAGTASTPGNSGMPEPSSPNLGDPDQ